MECKAAPFGKQGQARAQSLIGRDASGCNEVAKRATQGFLSQINAARATVEDAI